MVWLSPVKKRRVDHNDDDSDNGNCGDQSTCRTQKPAPPDNEQDDNTFQLRNDSSAPPSPPSSTADGIIPATSFKSCCIDIPKQIDKEYSRCRNTQLTNDIANEIIPAEENSAFLDNFGKIETIPYNQDVRGGEDGQKKPFDRHLVLTLNDEVVMRFPPYALETVEIIKSVIPRYKHHGRGAIFSQLRAFWSPDGTYYGCKWNGFGVKEIADMLWYSEFGFVGNSEERVRAHVAQRMVVNASPHFSGFSGGCYSREDVVMFQDIATPGAMTRFMNFSDQEMSLFNHIVQKTRQLNPDTSHSRRRTGLVARNDTQQSASPQDVITCLSEALATNDSTVYAFVSGPLKDMSRITMWSDVNALKERCLKKMRVKVQRNTIGLSVLFPNVTGEEDRLMSELQTVIFCLERVFSAKSVEEVQDLIIGIYWNAMRIRQEYAVHQLANECFHSADQDVLSHIHGFLTSDEIPSSPKCIRHGCTNISAPNPDASRRAGRGNDHETCNEPACANRCAWHANGERCTEPRSNGRKFCGGGTGCTHLFKGTKRQWEAEKRQRERAGEKFV